MSSAYDGSVRTYLERDEEGTVIGAADIVEIQGTVTGFSVSMVWTMEGRGTTDVAPEWTVLEMLVPGVVTT